MKVLLVLVGALALGACDSAAEPEPSTSTMVETTATMVTSTTDTTASTSTSEPRTTTTAEPSAPCHYAEPTKPDGSVLMFYAQCEFGELQPVYRVADAPPSLQESLEAMVAGVTQSERDFGLATGFDFVEEADEIEVALTADGDGTVYLDFRIGDERWHPGSRAGTSAQLISFFDPIAATVFRYPGVKELDRSTLCWGESGCGGTSTPAEWHTSLFVNEGILSHHGCTQELAWWYPELCTLDGVMTGPTGTATVVDVADDDVLNVRAGPGVDYYRMDELAPGAAVAATAVSAIASDGAEWRLTELGWVNARFLDGPGACDPTAIRSLAAEVIAAARLAPSAGWQADGGGVFSERATDADILARVLGYDCHWEATQLVNGAERHVVSAWTGDRIAMVIQAKDGPEDGYAEEYTVDVLVDAPRGEMVGDNTWAVELTEGNTLILATRNASNLGWLGKSWSAEYAFAPGDFPDSSDSWTDTERMALPALREAGGRNVSVAEPSHGSSVSAIFLISPAGDELSVTVGPVEQFTPWDYPGNSTVLHHFARTRVVELVDPGQEYPTSAATFTCDGHRWIVEASTGEIPETLGFVEELLGVLGCS